MTRRDPNAAASVRHASTYVLPLALVVSAAWPHAAAALLPLAVATEVVAVVDSFVWIFLWQGRTAPLCRGLWEEPQAIALPLLGNAMHAGWVVVCVVRGDFETTEVGAVVLASLGAALPYYALAVSLEPYAYALTRRELFAVALVGAGIGVGVSFLLF